MPDIDVSLIDVVDYIESDDEEREKIDGEFVGQPAECAAMHIMSEAEIRGYEYNREA